MKLQEFLAHKPLFYKKFDPLRMRRAYQRIAHRLNLPPIVHIVGTNGKGSTGRFLAGGLKEAGLRVGHYTSPHIFSFNERIWIDGKDIGDDTLELLHQKLLQLLQEEAKELSYFEYTTFLAALAFEGLDIAIMEAGLGGEFDATAVFPNDLTLVTPIDYDHKDFLGESIEQIAATKLRAVKKKALLAPQPHPQVYGVAKELGIGFERVEEGDKAMRICKEAKIPSFFAPNLALATAAAKKLGILVDPSQMVRYRMPGRFERKGNIILDVGHNPLSARAIVEALDKRVVLVYNSYEDKEYGEVLKILKPKIERVETLPIKNERIVGPSKLFAVLDNLGIEAGWFDGFKEEEYLVYGSFSVIEEIARWLPDSTNT